MPIQPPCCRFATDADHDQTRNKMTWPAIILSLFILYGVYAPATYALYLFFVVSVFGGLSLLPPAVAGNIPPDTLCTALLIFKTFSSQKRLTTLLNYALDMRKLGHLGVFSVYAVVTAFLYPRLFAGTVRVYALNGAGNLSSLAPTSSNIAQTIYMLISIGIGFVFAYSGQRPEFRRHVLYAILLNASILLLSGFIDMGFGAAGREDLLAPFHNATYHLLDSVTVAGQKRVVGFMPEASIFGSACCTSLALLLFNRRVYDGMLRKWIVPAVAIGLAYMTYASTSSGAYIGLAVIAVVAIVRFVMEMIFTERFTPRQIRALIGAIAAIFTVAGAYLFLPRSIIDHFATLLDVTLFQKSQSFSYLQRSSWTQAGIAAFWATDGIGVGVGSVRTSNWFVNFAASTGIIGLLLFGSFILRTLIAGKSYPDSKSRQFATGLKLALLPGLVVGSLSGTTPNPGAGLLLSMGLIYALQQRNKSNLPSRSGPALLKSGRSKEPHGRPEAGIA
jgi:hypothetical protein